MAFSKPSVNRRFMASSLSLSRQICALGGFRTSLEPCGSSVDFGSLQERHKQLTPQCSMHGAAQPGADDQRLIIFFDSDPRMSYLTVRQ